jgi:hypothetical protein
VPEPSNGPGVRYKKHRRHTVSQQNGFLTGLREESSDMPSLSFEVAMIPLQRLARRPQNFETPATFLSP